MKTRRGFVSNSSTSSFVILGEEIQPADLHLHLEKEIWCVGEHAYDGYDVWKLTRDDKDLIVTRADQVRECRFFVGVYRDDYSVEQPIDNTFPPQFQVFVGEQDQNGENDIMQYISRGSDYLEWSASW